MLISLELGEEAFTKLDEALHLHMPLEGPVIEIVNEMEINDCEVIFSASFVNINIYIMLV